MLANEDQSAPGYGRIAEVALLGLAALFFVVLTRYHSRHICDDAFIAFRYADNVAVGFGPVWNRGEPVEGFSSPLWLGLLVLGRLLGAPLPVWTAALGVGASLLCLVVVHRFALALSASRLVAAAAIAATSLIYPLYYWAPAGLETSLFALLATTAAWSLAVPASWWWAVAAAFLGVARPEGPFLVLVLIALARLAHGRPALRPGLLGLALAPALAWLVFRRAYYGEWLPNTYYAKATGALLVRLVAGSAYALWGILALAAAAATLWLGGIAKRANVAAAIFLSLALAAVVGAGGDWMWHGRMLVPVLPGLAALTVAGIAAASPHRRFALALACALAWSAFLPDASLLASAFAGGRLPEPAYQEGTLLKASLQAAQFISANYPADALVAVNHAGILPRALPNPTLDMTGLCDRHIAHEIEGRLHQKFDAAYVLSRRPRLVVLNSRTRPGTAGAWYHPGYWIGEAALVEQPEFAARYRPVPRFWEWQWQAAFDGGYILLYERIGEQSR